MLLFRHQLLDLLIREPVQPHEQVIHLCTPSRQHPRTTPRAETRTQTHLDLLGERDDVVLVELDDAVDVDLARRRVVQGLAVRGEVDSVEGRLLAEALEELALDLGLGDQVRERGAVARLDVRDERGRVVPELALRDELACGGAGWSVTGCGGWAA